MQKADEHLVRIMQVFKQLYVAGTGRERDPGIGRNTVDNCGRIHAPHIGMGTKEGVHYTRRFRDSRGTCYISYSSARLQRLICGRQKPLLESRKRSNILRLFPPSGFRPAAKGSKPGTRRVYKYAVE